jgi:sugar phosphate isomerase/epimerase
MPPQFSLAHLTVLHSTPPEMVSMAARSGYRWVGLRVTAVTPDEPVYPLMTDRAMMRETKARMADTGVGVLDIELARMDPATEPEAYLPLLEVTAELGAHDIIAQLPDDDRERAVERFVRLCDLAKPFGIYANLEFVSWTQTPDVASAVAVLKAANRSNAGLLVDTLHFSRSNCRLDELKNLPKEWFRVAQLCDAPKEAPATVEGLIHAARNDRQFLGEGGLAVRDIVEAMPSTTRYSLEIPNIALERVIGAEEFSRRAIRAAESYLQGVHESALMGYSMV